MTREELLDLATSFRDRAAEELRDAETDEDLFQATLRAHQRLNQLEQQLFTDYQVKVDCKAGCGICCFRGKIDARAHDILTFADWIKKNFTPEDLDAVLQRAQAHAAAVS